MPAIPGNDPDVVALQNAARDLQRRGATDKRIHDTVERALHPVVPPLQLPASFKITHQTAGLPGFGAVDLFRDPGTPVLAAEDGVLVWPHQIVWDAAKRVGGWAFYFQGVSGNTFFDAHLAEVVPAGRYRKGDLVGTVAPVPHGWWPSHIHHAKHVGRYNPPQT